jgi:hypothetical protein
MKAVTDTSGGDGDVGDEKFWRHSLQVRLLHGPASWGSSRGLWRHYYGREKCERRSIWERTIVAKSFALPRPGHPRTASVFIDRLKATPSSASGSHWNYSDLILHSRDGSHVRPSATCPAAPSYNTAKQINRISVQRSCSMHKMGCTNAQ